MKQKIFKVSNFLLIVFFILFIVYVNNLNNKTDSSNKIVSDVLQDGLLEEKNSGDNKEDIKNSEKNLEKSVLYKVEKVVDGDTIKIYINNVLENIRLIGLDTPETVDPRKEVQCFGVEASNKAKEMLSEKNVILEKDVTQGERDKYGRLLLYVYLEDGTLFNRWMIENGYGHEYTYNIPYKYQIEFQNAEKYARENKLGLWADNVCVNTKSTNNNSQTSVDSHQVPINEITQTLEDLLVKKSSTGICHEKRGTYYEKTKNFIAYESIESCLNSGGRLPKS